MRPETVGCVVNPTSGDGDGARLGREVRSLFPAATVSTTVTSGPAEVPVAARDYLDRDLLVGVGGDGTLGEVADALPVDAPPLFVVPAGRGNSAYRHLYGDRDWRDVARGLAEGVDARDVDVGLLSGEPAVDRDRFVLGVSAGLFRRALDAAESLRFLPGPLAYFLGSARATVSETPVDVTVEGDGEPVFDGEARLVAVGGGRYRGSAFELLPESRPADGRLHLLVVEATGGLDLLRVTRLARDGSHVSHPAVTYARAERFVVESPDGLPAEVDGSPLPGLRSVDLRVDPGGLTLAYPD